MREISVTRCSDTAMRLSDGAACESVCENSPDSLLSGPPSGAVGSPTDRGADGRFTPGNRAPLVVGHRSMSFWSAHEEARQALVAAVVSDAGHGLEDAPKALAVAADGLAQAVLLRDSAFAR